MFGLGVLMSPVSVAASFRCSRIGGPFFARGFVCGTVNNSVSPQVCHVCPWCAGEVFLEVSRVRVRVG